MASRQLTASLLDTDGALNSCVDLGQPHLKAQCVTWTQAAGVEVGARRELRTKAWRCLEWSSNEELLEWAGEDGSCMPRASCS